MHQPSASELLEKLCCVSVTWIMFPLSPFLLDICSCFSNITTYRGMVHCEAQSLTFSERLSVFKNRVLRNTFECMQEEVRWGLRKQHSKLLHTVHWPPDMIRDIRYKGIIWVLPVACMGQERYFVRHYGRKNLTKRYQYEHLKRDELYWNEWKK